jgi:hypothetical protein
MHPEVEVLTLDELYAEVDRQIADAARWQAELDAERVIDAEVVND